MATLAYSRIAIAGTLAAPVAASAGGDKVAPNDRGFLDVNNGGGSPITVTIAVPGNTSYLRPAPAAGSARSPPTSPTRPTAWSPSPTPASPP